MIGEEGVAADVEVIAVALDVTIEQGEIRRFLCCAGGPLGELAHGLAQGKGLTDGPHAGVEKTAFVFTLSAVCVPVVRYVVEVAG